MVHQFCPGYTGPYAALVADYPGDDVYPVKSFRTEWGPIFHRGRLDGTAKVLVLGQDPATHESIARRILVGEAGQRTQGLLARLGITESYVMINTFLYSVYGQGGGTAHQKDQKIADYRNSWIDTILANNAIEAIITLGTLAKAAYGIWSATASPAAKAIHAAPITHPTYPESSSASGQTTKAEAMAKMLANWNDALPALHQAIAHPDHAQALQLYGTTLTPADLAVIPEGDLPPGLPDWMRQLEAWAARTGPDANTKRVTITVTIPTKYRPPPLP
jgi:uracil-DNA glycosylase